MTTADPSFSLIVNTIDRSSSLQTLLRSLEHQSYPNFEVIVVVGPTKDNTLEVLEEYRGRIRLLRCPDANLARSRNIGLLEANGDVVAFVDDDAVPCYRWLEQLARIFKTTTIDGTGGMVYAIHPNFSTVQYRIGVFSALAEQVDVRTSHLEQLAPNGWSTQWRARMMGTNMAYRRRALLEAGGFDERLEYLVDDAEASFRLANRGRNVQPVQEAVVYHVPASSRNRRMFTFKGRWWIRTKARVYFSSKYGLEAGEPWRSYATRTIRHMGANYLFYLRLQRNRDLSLFEAFPSYIQEALSGLDGLVKGVFLPRQLIEPARAEEKMAEQPAPILKFQNEHSKEQPSVDPVSGARSEITLSEPPLRICLLSNQYPPEQFGGVGRLTHLMAQGLFALGHTVHVVTFGEQEQVSFYDGAYVHKIPLRLGRYEHYQRYPNLYFTLNFSHAVYEKVKRLVLNDGIQLVDSALWQYDGLVTLMSGIIPVVVRLLTSVKQIAQIHNSRVMDFHLMGELEKVLLEKAHHLLPNTKATLESVSQVYNLPIRDRSTIVPYGIVPAPQEEVRPFDLNKAHETLTVLFVGRLEKRKGILELFEAVPRVIKKMPNARFIFAGADNSPSDGFLSRTGMDYPAFFANRYRNYQSNVQFLGAVSEERLQSLYQTCDVFVAPSIYESFGLIYLEAMNYAKPVIACRSGGVPEVVEHDVTGLLVEPGAADELATAILSLLQSPERMRELGLAGRGAILDRFHYMHMARNFERVYREVIHSFDLQTPSSVKPQEEFNL